jgi:hypothetical protein
VQFDDATSLDALGMLLRAKCGLRWDSDHVVILNDGLPASASGIAANGYDRPDTHPHCFFGRQHHPDRTARTIARYEKGALRKRKWKSN